MTKTILSILSIFILIYFILSMRLILRKAGRKWWEVFIPFYNNCIVFKITGRPWWWIFLLNFPLTTIPVLLIHQFDLSKSFGKNRAFGLLGFFFPFITLSILAYGKSRYIGPEKDEKASKTIFMVNKYFYLALFALITIIPIILTVMGGLKSLSQLRENFLGIPNPFAWENFKDMLSPKRSAFLLNLFNSTFIMIFTVTIDMILSCLAGFALSRLKFPGREVVYNFFLLGLLFPLAIAILPLYLQVKRMYLLNNYFGVILPQVAFSMPWHIMLTRGFFMQIPKDIEEAAVIDGCGHFRFFLMFILPLSTPVLATISVLTMVTSWNNFFLPLLILNNEKLFTLPMGVMKFQGQYMFQWNLILTYITLAIIPAIIFYILTQKYIISGLTSGSIKG